MITSDPATASARPIQNEAFGHHHHVGDPDPADEQGHAAETEEQCVQRGVRRVCLKDGGVIKREIERKEKSTDSDDRVAAQAEFLASSGEQPGREQHDRRNQQAIECRCGPRHRGPPHKNCGPRDAGDSDDECGVRPLFTASEFVHEKLFRRDLRSRE